MKANIIGEFGDPAEAVRQFDALIAEKPGSPTLLNGRCWVKGTRSVMVEGALKDCTEAIELGSENNNALDSRGLIWFRLGRHEEALRDFNAVLRNSPGAAASLFMRGVILGLLNRKAEAAKDALPARRLRPSMNKQYGRYGIKA